MFGSWQIACGYNANIPMGKVSREEITIERVESLARLPRKSAGSKTNESR